MVQLFLIAVSAGAASALLFTSLVSGAPLALLLAQLAPLPVLIAGIGWSHWSALLAVILAASAMGLSLGGLFFVAFLFTVGLPAWWLSYLALLARPSSAPAKLDWYPVGRLIVWSCLFGAVVTTAGLIKIAGFEGTFEAALRAGFERFLRVQAGLSSAAPLQLPGVSDPDRFLDLLVLTIPAAAASTAATTNLVNLWLAGRIVQVSGRLKRPWPAFGDFRLPAMAAAGFAITAVGSFLPELPGTLCRVVAACLAVAHVLLGFAVVHAATAALKNRVFVLASTYALVAVFQWPALALLAIGLSDALIDWRARLARKLGPPPVS
jgi:hypothetical protein